MKTRINSSPFPTAIIAVLATAFVHTGYSQSVTPYLVPPAATVQTPTNGGFIPTYFQRVPTIPSASDVGIVERTLSIIPASVSDGIHTPPDLAGAVGPNHLVSMLNSGVLMMSKFGSVLSQPSLAQFWNASTNIAFASVFDPQVAYDPYADRWIAAAITDDNSTNSSLCVAVSLSANPTNTWNLRQVPADTNSSKTVWADRPMLGFNKKWVVVQANMFQITNSTEQPFVRSHIWVFNKSNLYAGNLGSYTLFIHTNSVASAKPAVTLDPDEEDLYLIQCANGNAIYPTTNSHSGVLRQLRITGPVGSEVLTNATPGTEIYYYDEGATWAQRMATNQNSNVGPQIGATNQTNSPPKLHAGDDRIQHTIFRNGFLYCVHTIYEPATNQTHTSVAFWRINPSTRVSRRAVISGSASSMYAFPSLAVNKFGEVFLGYSSFSSNSYAGAKYSLWDPGQSSVTTNGVLVSGSDTYWWEDRGLNRWGDYTSTCVDPVDDHAFFTLQQYATNHSGTLINQSGRWASSWCRLGLPVSTNDHFDSAWIITGDSNDVHDVPWYRPTLESAEPVHYTNFTYTGSIWFKWTAQAQGGLYLYTDPESNTGLPDARIAVYTGSVLTNLTRASARYDGPGVAILDVQQNTTYYMAVCAEWPTRLFEFRLRAHLAPAFVVQPSPPGLHLLEGDPLSLTGYAVARDSITYQWKLDGTNISGATATNYTVAAMRSTNAGVYTLQASTAYSTLSSNVIVEYHLSAAQPLENMSVTTNGFKTIQYEVQGRWYAFEASTNLIDWVGISTNQLPGSTNGLWWEDSSGTNYPRRFYRTRFIP